MAPTQNVNLALALMARLGRESGVQPTYSLHQPSLILHAVRVRHRPLGRGWRLPQIVEFLPVPIRVGDIKPPAFPIDQAVNPAVTRLNELDRRRRRQLLALPDKQRASGNVQRRWSNSEQF